MKFILPEKRFAKTCLLLVFAALLFSTGLQAQTKKRSSAPQKKTVAKKTTATAKDARKSNKKETVAKKSTKADSKKATAKSDRRDSKKAKKNDKDTAKANARDKKNAKPDKKMSAKERRREEARRRAEEARRQAAIAAQRRREEAARIARERKLAFERGLRTQTAENILKDNTAGEDLAVRAAAVDALGSRAGTVVVMEAKTGKVLTMVNQEWAIKQSFKPCSTIKLVTGVAGLNEKVINEEGGIGSSTSGLDLNMALARSNNGYFQRAGVNFGNEKMIRYAKSLGLGERTGINAEGETTGRLPFGNKNPRIYSHGDDFEVSPLQLAVMVSAIANDGKKVVPQIVRPQTQKAAFKPKFRDEVKVPYETMQGVLPGMIGAAEYGTAARGVDHSQGIAGKTGSCIFKGSWIGLFASVAPVEDPQYSVVVITRGEGERGKYAAAIAGQVYRTLAPRLRRHHEKYVAIKNLRPTHPTDGMAFTDDEEEDDAAAGDVAEERSIIVAGAAQKRADEPKKLIQKTNQSRPTTPAPVRTSAPIKTHAPVKTSTPAKAAVKTEAKPSSFKPVVIKYDKEKAAGLKPRTGEAKPKVPAASQNKSVTTRPRVVKN